MVRHLITVFVLVAVSTACAEEATSRHNEAGNTGANGVKEYVALKINKLTGGKDTAIIQVDLGDHKYESVKPEELIKNRPVIKVTMGSHPTMTGICNDKGQIIGEQFKAKLVNSGAGMKITVKKATLTALLSDISGKGTHGFLTVTIQDEHSPSIAAASTSTSTAEPAADSRHARSIYSKEFEVDVKENEKSLVAKG